MAKASGQDMSSRASQLRTCIGYGHDLHHVG